VAASRSYGAESPTGQAVRRGVRVRSGGLWAIIHADSAEAIRERYLELGIADSRPPWMTDERFAELPRYDLDAPPPGVPLAVLADRET